MATNKDQSYPKTVEILNPVEETLGLAELARAIGANVRFADESTADQWAWLFVPMGWRMCNTGATYDTWAAAR